MNQESLSRADRTFGDGKLLGKEGDSFFDLPLEEQARRQGWSNACPVVERLIKPEKDGGRGAENMRNRYGAVNFQFRVIANLLQEKGRNDLHAVLTSPMERQPDEPMGKHDKGWPPQSLETHMLGVGNPFGYALPRVLLEFIHENDTEKAQERYVFALNAFENAAERSRDIVELAVTFTETLALESDNVPRLLYHLIGQGKMEEDNCRQAYEQLARIMKRQDGKLWREYSGLTREDRSRLRIAYIPV